MIFTEEQLKTLIKGKMVGELYPYNTNDEQAVLDYLKRVQAEFEWIPNIKCEPDILHFGSGYASYVEWFIYSKDEIRLSEAHGLLEIEKEGLVIDISLLSPVILIGTGWKSDSIRIETGEKVSGGKTFFGQAVDLEIPDKYAALKSVVERTFMKYHYTILRKEDVMPRMPFQAEIPTLLRAPHEYLIWDAIFYWED